eukprot:8590076-Pyramimonas_sp.AAC.1
MPVRQGRGCIGDDSIGRQAVRLHTQALAFCAEYIKNTSSQLSDRISRIGSSRKYAPLHRDR